MQSSFFASVATPATTSATQAAADPFSTLFPTPTPTAAAQPSLAELFSTTTPTLSAVASDPFSILVPTRIPTAKPVETQTNTSATPSLSTTAATTVSFNYARAVDDNLLCVICSEPAVDPLYHESCTALFCTNCLKSWLPRSASCPKCRARTPSISNFVVNNFIEKLLNELPIHCPNKASGCTTPATINRGDLAAHLDKFCVVAQCANKAKGCQWQNARAQLNGHLQFDCKYFIVACSTPGCTVKFERHRLSAHLAASCDVLIKQAAQEAEAKKAADILKKKQEEQAAKLALMNPIHTHIVTLSVGGTRFQVSAQLLLKYPTSCLGLMFSGKWEVRCNQDNVVFLEFDPIAFASVLRWLQTGELIDSDANQSTASLARLLELEELENQLKPLFKKQRQNRLTQHVNKLCKTYIDEDLSDLSLMHVTLSEANFCTSNMERCIVRGANLCRAIFIGARLNYCDFSYAQLESAQFNDAELSCANFQGARLSGTCFIRAKLNNANFTGTHLSEKTIFCNADLRNADFTGKSWRNLQEMQFDGANMAGINCSNCDFAGFSLHKRDMRGWNCTGASLRYCSLDGANLAGANFTNATLEYVHDAHKAILHGTIVVGVTNASSEFKEAWQKQNSNAKFPASY